MANKETRRDRRFGATPLNTTLSEEERDENLRSLLVRQLPKRAYTKAQAVAMIWGSNDGGTEKI